MRIEICVCLQHLRAAGTLCLGPCCTLFYTSFIQVAMHAPFILLLRWPLAIILLLES